MSTAPLTPEQIAWLKHHPPPKTPRTGGPRVSSGKDSEQVVATPWEFIHACERRWGDFVWDLAATNENSKASKYIDERANSLTVDWHKLTPGNLWLNPPFSDIAPWARKCWLEMDKGAKIFFLVPASIDSNWWAECVHDQACVLPLHPRIKFEGHDSLYQKPLTLCLFGTAEAPGYPGRWLWKEQKNESMPALQNLL